MKKKIYSCVSLSIRNSFYLISASLPPPFYPSLAPLSYTSLTPPLLYSLPLPHPISCSLPLPHPTTSLLPSPPSLHYAYKLRPSNVQKLNFFVRTLFCLVRESDNRTASGKCHSRNSWHFFPQNSQR